MLHPFAALAFFKPRLIQALQGYSRDRLLRDIGAGITVGIVALPLAMAFAIASGLKPEAGIWTAIIAGAIVAALGGSAVQIAGPAGAFIVIVYGIVERDGLPNLLISTGLAGVLLVLMGALKLGTLVRFVPVSIVMGFTNGIAVLIGLSQLKDFLGLNVARMPADFFGQGQALLTHLHTFNPQALALGAACLLGLLIWPHVVGTAGQPGLAQGALRALPSLEALQLHRATRVASRLPGPIVALLSLSVLAHVLQLPVDTIGSRFGGIPQGLPPLSLPAFSWDSASQLLAPTLTIAVLVAIESLLCARVADQVSGLKRHDPNQELMAQGLANMVVPFFGGMPVTGTVARTITNVRAGATSPIAGLVHSATLLLIVLLAAPLAMHVPLAVLAGVLMHVAWNMGEWREFARLKAHSRHSALLMLGTFVLTVVFDLTVALQVGLVLACVLFVQRMASLFRVSQTRGSAHMLSFSLHGALFFGAVAKLDPVLDALESAGGPLTVRLDLSALQALDRSGLEVLEQLHHAAQAQGGRLEVWGAHGEALTVMQRAGLMDKLSPSTAPEPGGPAAAKAQPPIA
jgi:SulP family sulfate permease